MKKLPFYLKIVSFIFLLFIWDYIFINYKNLPLSIPIHFDWDGKPNFFAPRNIVWVLAGISTFIYLLIFYLTKNINSPLLKMPDNIKQDTMKAERIVSIFHLIIMVLLTVITYEAIGVGVGRTEALSPVPIYIIVLLIIGVIGMLIYSYFTSKKKGFQNPIS